MKVFGVGPTAPSLGLASYTLGSGIEPLLWPSVSEIVFMHRL